MDRTYRVLMNGAKPGADAREVRANLAKLFKAAPEQVERLLASPGHVLKGGLTARVAAQYQAAIESAGAMCAVEAEGVETPTPQVDLRADSQDTRSCPFCAEPIKLNAVFCKHCRRDLPGESGPPAAITTRPAESSSGRRADSSALAGRSSERHAGPASTVALWNPNAAANWSLLFSPIFGSFLNAANWKALGEDKRAAASHVWAYVSTAVLVVALFLPDAVGRGIGLWLLVTWYFFAGRKQARYVKDKYGLDYAKREWGRPLGIGVAGLLAFLILAFGVESLFKNRTPTGTPERVAIAPQGAAPSSRPVAAAMQSGPATSPAAATRDSSDFKNVFTPVNARDGKFNADIDISGKTAADIKAHVDLAAMVLGQQRMRDAESSYIVAARIAERLHGPNSVQYAEVLALRAANLYTVTCQLAWLEANSPKSEGRDACRAAESQLKRAIPVLDQGLGPGSEQSEMAREALVTVFESTNRKAEAAELRKPAPR